LKNADVSYDLVHGWDYAEPILDHIKTNSRQGLIDIYKIALGGAPNCGIIRATRPSDGAILGTVVIYNGRSPLAEHMPVLKATQPSSGGISSPVISPSVGEYATVMQGLILLGIKQIRRQGAEAVVIDCVSSNLFLSSVPSIPFALPAHGLSLHLDLQYVNTIFLQVDGDSNFDCLSGMGFSMLHSFEEVNCDAATWSMMPTT
jgi:beta-N-acetylhexosaminidase